MTRTAISPRLAMRIFLSTPYRGTREQVLRHI
jgi:hypothetical protein